MSLSLLSRACSAAVLLLFFACHDAPRDNPFDPALTPAVQLQVALDDTAGTATLTWTHYEGQQPFREYRVLRNIADRKSVDTLAQIPAVAQTAFVDTTLEPNTAYVYRVETLNAGGYAAPSEERSMTGFSVGAVRLLGVENDQDSGGLVLRWNRYVGPDFVGYQVWRRVGETIQEDLLAVLGAVQDTVWVDTAARADVGYVYRVMVRAAGRELESNSQEGRLVLPGVELLAPEFSSATASATLKWTAYEGPRFKAYHVERRTEELVPQILKEIPDPADTSFVDRGLLGNTEYFYRVVVVTERDEEVKSEEQSGRFHALVQSWPLDLAEGEQVRLYWEEDRLTALVAGPGRVQLRFFDSQGQRLGEQTLLENPFAGNPLFGQWSPPQAVATTRLPDGSRLLSFPSLSGEALGLLEFAPDGELQWNEEERLAEGALPAASVERESYLGQWGLSVFKRREFGDNVAAAFSAVEVEVDGEVRMQGTDFAREEQWAGVRFSYDNPGDLGSPFTSWVFGNSRAAASGIIVVENSLLSLTRTILSHQGAWKSFAMRAQVALMRSGASIYIGSLEGPYLGWPVLGLDLKSREVLLSTDKGPILLEKPFPVFPGVPYRLRLEADEGAFSAYAAHPVYWSNETAEGTRFVGLAQFGDFVGVVAGNQPFILDPEAKAEEKLPLDRPVSEVRSWERENRGRLETWAGLCLPEQHQIRYARAGVNRTTGEFSWPFDSPNLISRLGQGLGQEGGEMVFPLSFDVGPDGRFFVLDAGNGRLQVFGAEGEYLTQWGHKGSGEGEFDFGAGALGAEDLAGSVAVDREGYIYVADVGNKRIQKFAP